MLYRYKSNTAFTLLSSLYKLRRTSAFTLAELLIALAILGVIATFTIPKILDSGSSSKHNAIVKEAVATVSEAFQMYKRDNGSIIDTGINEYTPYINYVSIDTTTLIDSSNLSASLQCEATGPCLNLHNGGKLWYHVDSGVKFRTTESTGAVRIMVDPDGIYGGSTTGSPKSTSLYLYSNGRITTRANIDPLTYISGTGPIAPAAGADPEYLNWSN